MTLKTTVRRALISGAATVALAAAVSPGSAAADAVGIEPFGGGTVPTPWGEYPVPQGELDHGVTGDGLFVESQKAGFTTVPSLCNWNLTYELRDLNGNVLDSRNIDPGSRCDTNVSIQGVEWNKTTSPGFACAVLRVASSEIATQCHQVAG